MPRPVTPEQLVSRLDERPLLLVTDYDGTLVPIAPTPGEAVPAPKVVELLRALAGLERVRAAVVSGRPAEQLEEWLPAELLYLAGAHGAVIREPGGNKVELAGGGAAKKELAEVVRQGRELIREKKGFILEDKGISVALHYRLACPEEAQKVVSRFRALAAGNLPGAYELLEGKKVVEVRPRDLHKGRALEWLLSRFPGYAALYLGDDVTDEDAFRAVQGRGTGVLVARRDRPSGALYRLGGPEEVIKLLKLICKRFTEETGC